ncbi:MAG TPA: gluconate 2-dehydrogenase subunit 3 family protein [Terriglobales bacterium]|nr:gluconate 2-dehydrogenase subunit 3 family protein [Terriglobales bacterium]
MRAGSISRRDVLRTLTIGTVAGSVLRVIPAQAAEYAHRMIAEEKSASPANKYIPKFFPPEQYMTLRALCQTIIPADAECGGAVEAGAPEFIDLLTSENADFQVAVGGGLMWLDSTCHDRYGKAYLECGAAQQKEILDLIAYSKNAESDAGLSQGVEFFSFLRGMTADGFFTSKTGIEYLKYIGNTYLTSFPGCPPVPGV